MLEHDRKKEGIPTGGKWYAEQEKMYTALAQEQNENVITVAWDKISTKGKCYGLYPSKTEFYEAVLRLAPDQRCGYELINRNAPCAGYADFEWYNNQPDPTHKMIKWVLGNIRVDLKTIDKRTAALLTYCGTREEDGMIKHSYHIIIPEFIWENNHDGTMKTFFTQLVTEDDRWYYSHIKKDKKTGEMKKQTKTIVDLSVYTSSRPFRLPLCCKRGSSVPLVLITNDPFDDDDLTPCYSEDIDELLPSFVSNPVIDGDKVLIECNQGKDTEKAERKTPGKQPKDKIKNFKQSSVNTRYIPCTEEDLPFYKRDVSDLLMLNGDTVSSLTTQSKDTKKQGWRFQGQKRCHLRPCLLSQGKTHENNQCMIYVEPDGPGSFQVNYKCMASECTKYLCLGVVKGKVVLRDNAESTEQDHNVSGSNEAEQIETMDIAQDGAEHDEHDDCMAKLIMEMEAQIQKKDRETTLTPTIDEDFLESHRQRVDSIIELMAEMDAEREQITKPLTVTRSSIPGCITKAITCTDAKSNASKLAAPKSKRTDYRKSAMSHKTASEQVNEVPVEHDENSQESSTSTTEMPNPEFEKCVKSAIARIEAERQREKKIPALTPPKKPDMSESLSFGYRKFSRKLDKDKYQQFLDPLPLLPAIVLASPCGTGKTKAALEWIEKISSQGPVAVIFVAHRKAVSRSNYF